MSLKATATLGRHTPQDHAAIDAFLTLDPERRKLVRDLIAALAGLSR